MTDYFHDLLEGNRPSGFVYDFTKEGVRLIMNMIDYYQFGLIVIDGKRYSSDVIIFPNGVKDG